jgi:hypothetical protein
MLQYSQHIKKKGCGMTTHPTESPGKNLRDYPLLSFWAIGDLHYRAVPFWNAAHTERLAPMFQDTRDLWQEEGLPAFAVSPGDLVEACARENHQLAKHSLLAHLDTIPFYPGIGNHEFLDPDEAEDSTFGAQTYSTEWGKPVRYSWTIGMFACIMLDYPGPDVLEDPKHLLISQETLRFLDDSLTAHTDQKALIFFHAPLHNTVLDRDLVLHRDYNSLQGFFAPENSEEMREILARHSNACLYFSGHTHSGWEAPNLVCTEHLGEHPVTFVNLMSPWYTGRKTGLRPSADGSTQVYIPDDPNVIPTFFIRLYQDRASIRVRDHLSRTWLKEWIVPIA